MNAACSGVRDAVVQTAEGVRSMVGEVLYSNEKLYNNPNIANSNLDVPSSFL